MKSAGLLTSFSLVAYCSAATHHLFTSSFSTPHLYALEFDDDANTLVDVANITGHDGHPWMAFSYDKSSLYAGERDGFASYTVENSSSLLYNRSVSVMGACGSKTKEIGMSYVIAELRTPFTVYGAPFGNCGAAISVDTDLNLQEIIQNFTYRENSAVHGLALDPESRFLYSADDSANGIWTHSIDDRGRVTQMGFTPAPWPDSGPRSLVVHPNGKYLYVVLAKTNAVAVYAINSGAEATKTPLANTGVSYSLLPQGK
jgi:carboxy-cis,cis-muconate cyclase